MVASMLMLLVKLSLTLNKRLAATRLVMLVYRSGEARQTRMIVADMLTRACYLRSVL